MTYTELETTVSNHFSAGEWDEIVDLINRENVAVAVKCAGKPYTPPTFQPLTRPNELLQDYKDLRSAVEAAPSASHILQTVFVPENVLLADLGAEYRSSVTQAEIAFTEVGWGDPTAAAITAVTEHADDITDSQNPQPDNQC